MYKIYSLILIVFCFNANFASADSIATLILNNELTKSDYFKAKLMAGLGNNDAKAALGAFYLTGIHVDMNKALGMKLVSSASNSGNKYATYGLAKIYQEGVHTKRNYHKSYTLYKRLAEQNIKEAQYELGLSYRDGLGIKANTSKAIYWLTKAKDNGSYEAEKQLKLMKN